MVGAATVHRQHRRLRATADAVATAARTATVVAAAMGAVRLLRHRHRVVAAERGATPLLELAAREVTAVLPLRPQVWRRPASVATEAREAGVARVVTVGLQSDPMSLMAGKAGSEVAVRRLMAVMAVTAVTPEAGC